MLRARAPRALGIPACEMSVKGLTATEYLGSRLPWTYTPYAIVTGPISQPQRDAMELRTGIQLPGHREYNLPSPLLEYVEGSAGRKVRNRVRPHAPEFRRRKTVPKAGASRKAGQFQTFPWQSLKQGTARRTRKGARPSLFSRRPPCMHPTAPILGAYYALALAHGKLV